MPGDVAERFLRDAEDRERNGFAKAREPCVGCAGERHVERRARREAFGPVGERAGDAAVQLRRAQARDGLLIRLAHRIERLLRDAERFGARRRSVGGQPRFEARQREARGGQRGAGGVVQFLREHAAHALVGGRELGGKLMHACRETLDFAIRGQLGVHQRGQRRSRASGGIVRGVRAGRLARRERRRLNVAKGRMAWLALIQYRSSRRLHFNFSSQGAQSATFAPVRHRDVTKFTLCNSKNVPSRQGWRSFQCCGSYLKNIISLCPVRIRTANFMPFRKLATPTLVGKTPTGRVTGGNTCNFQIAPSG
ncbi:hypothetical protein BG61_29800 [Caballeronia glathei]|uniref:Uncharacterized protein n=1 Tax=Caballeronia glathei TaxID=60547 RepID=A0A069PRG8_9BURK|nr:hypothetical protein BG61_29800 [Caballeronia glathei]